uniref:Uncharacterized protein n=1 Tax=Magallana gigas TaxID=29159 RepID=A0A8W8NUC4_MAGGI
MQCTCVTVKPRGLSLAIGKAFPWGDINGQRKAVKGRNLAVQTSRDLPGIIKVFKAPEQGTPDVACLFARWDFVKTVFVVVESPVKPVLDLTNSSDDDIPAPKKRAIDSSSDSDQKESLLLLTIPVFAV